MTKTDPRKELARLMAAESQWPIEMQMIKLRMDMFRIMLHLMQTGRRLWFNFIFACVILCFQFVNAGLALTNLYRAHAIIERGTVRAITHQPWNDGGRKSAIRYCEDR